MLENEKDGVRAGQENCKIEEPLNSTFEQANFRLQMQEEVRSSKEKLQEEIKKNEELIEEMARVSKRFLVLPERPYRLDFEKRSNKAA